MWNLQHLFKESELGLKDIKGLKKLKVYIKFRLPSLASTAIEKENIKDYKM